MTKIPALSCKVSQKSVQRGVLVMHLHIIHIIGKCIKVVTLQTHIDIYMKYNVTGLVKRLLIAFPNYKFN